MSATPAKNAGSISHGSCTNTPATVMLTIAPAVVSASRWGSLRQVQTLAGSSPKKATTGAENVGTWIVHASMSAVIVLSPMNTDRRQRPGVGAISVRNDSIIRGVRPTVCGGAGTTLMTDARPQRGGAAAAMARGKPRMVTTAVVPIRNGCST